MQGEKRALKSKIFVEINMSHSKLKGVKSSADGTFEYSQDTATRYLPVHVAFTISQRNEVLNFFVFLYFRGSVQSPDAKRAQIRP